MLEIVRLIVFVARTSRGMRLSGLAVAVSIVAGLASGVGYTSLVALINSALTVPEDRRQLLVSFAALCVAVPVARLISQLTFNWLSARALFDLRLQICRRILDTPLRELEIAGTHRLFASLTDDVNAIHTSLATLPVLFTHVAIIATCLIYMGWLSGTLLLVVLGFMALGVITYQLPLIRSHRHLVRLREELDTLFGHFRGLIHGAKELKLHRSRRQAFLNEALTPTGEEIRRLTFLSTALFTGAGVWGNLLFFLVLGLLLFGFGGEGGPHLRVLSGYTLALLYLATPLEVLLNSLPTLARASAASAKLEKLGLSLASVPPEPAEGIPPTGWQRLELAGAGYTYWEGGREGDGPGFHVGPIDLAFQPGELVFLIGGNGSGKSTLAKVLTGLYPPETGEIRLDGQPVTAASRDAYRQLFAAVFTDFYLFDALLGLERPDLDDDARDYLVRLRLEDKVKVEGGRLSSVELSQGQRKRLALLTAYLEDRPIYFFDEWAADQDPHARSVFYFELLPELKARGKTVFVVTHDDAYYGIADRLIKLTDGKVEWDRRGAVLSPPVAR